MNNVLILETGLYPDPERFAAVMPGAIWVARIFTEVHTGNRSGSVNIVSRGQYE